MFFSTWKSQTFPPWASKNHILKLKNGNDGRRIKRELSIRLTLSNQQQMLRDEKSSLGILFSMFDVYMQWGWTRLVRLILTIESNEKWRPLSMTTKLIFSLKTQEKPSSFGPVPVPSMVVVSYIPEQYYRYWSDGIFCPKQNKNVCKTLKLSFHKFRQKINYVRTLRYWPKSS